MTPPADRRPRGVAARTAATAVLGLGLLGLLFCTSLALGSRPIPLGQVLRALADPDSGVAATIVWQLRMPRAVAAVLVGIGLSTAGLVMQALTRNPLAEPGLLGVNSGASLAVVVAVAAAGVSDAAGYVWWAMAGSAAAAGLVLALGGTRAGARSGHRVRVVLAGTALGASLGAVTGIITMLDARAFDSHRFWVVGSLAHRDLGTVAATAWPILLGAALAVLLGGSLNVLDLGEDSASALGLPVGLVRGAGLLAVTLCAGGATALAGPVGFVGLVVPHVLRILLGTDLRRLLPVSLVAGPCLVLLADVVGRLLGAPGEIEVGVVTAFLGAPVLLGLVLRRAA